MKNPDIQTMCVMHDEYRTQYEFYNSIHLSNLHNQDTALVQLSVGLLAVLTTLGKEILLVNKLFSFILLTLFTMTIIQVVIGYFIANRFFIFVKKKITKNYADGIDLDIGVRDSIWSKIGTILNISQYITFILGLISFLILIFIYLKELI